MKSWKCPECDWKKETKDNIVFVACSCCLTEMKLNEVKKRENARQTKDTN